ncbi:MAG: arginine--tRNA ligase [Clostridia bacterium]|nr:arginine--tRNA ligase [Clostridia bacterium]
MDYKSEIAKLIKIEGATFEEILSLVVIAKDTALADYAFPCFKFAKTLRKSPVVIANEIVYTIEKPAFVESIEAVNGYVNFKLSKLNYVKEVVEKASSLGENFGDNNIGNGKTICIDYSSINIAKPFHMGHLSTTVIGASLYKIYKKLGYNVVGINHLGDWGTQFGKLIVAYKMWGNQDDVNNRGINALLEIYIKFHKEAEQNDSLNDLARSWFKKIEDGDNEATELFLWFKKVTLRDVQKIYDRLDVQFDSYNGESFYNDKMQPVLDEIEAKGLAKVSNGATIVEFDESEDMPPCLLKKADGATLYATRDLAAAFYRKNTYDFYKSLYVVAYQQNLHFKQLFKVVEMMGYDWAKDMVHVPFGMVSIEGEKLSTREGNVVFLEDVLNNAKAKALQTIDEKNPDLEDKDNVAEMVGTGAVIFGALVGSRIKDISFSYDKVLNFEGETGPYVQYTYARCSSLLSKIEGSNNINYDNLTSIESYELIKLIDKYPDILIDAGNKYEPSILTRYIYSLACQFNKFYLEQNISNAAEEDKSARLTVVKVVKDIIKNGMSLLGIKCPEKM